MLNFRNRRMTNYLERNQQYKLMALMGALVLVLLLVSLAGEPQRWNWLVPGDEPRQQAPFRPDTRLAKADTGEAADGTFRVPSEGIVEADPAAFLRGLRTDYLIPVRDDTVFRDAESDGWLHLLETLMKTDPKTLSAASVGKISFRQLYEQPKFYRGKVVSLAGMVRGVRQVPAMANDLGIKHYYQLSLEPHGEPNQLVVVYALNLPKGFPQGDSVEAAVQLTGFFFKRWAYASKDAVRTAPLVLVNTVTWKPLPATTVPGDEVSFAWAAGVAFGLFVIAALGFIIMQSMRSNPRSQQLIDAPFSADRLAELEATADASDNESTAHSSASREDA
jgi:hypothetical protein